ncbi:MAG: methyltransferase [Elusimicrobia bacterium]|nr:methyltransferase [Elusimicrobiota bacterium]
MTPTKEKPPVDEREKKDVLDHIEDFIENRIEKNIKKGIEDLEKFVKEELLKRGHKRGDEPGPLSYIEAFLDDPKVATVMPSSKFVIERVTKMIDWSATKTIVEFGPAEGVITQRLLELLPKDGRLVGIELNDKFVAALKKIKDPRLHVVHGSVLDIEEHLRPLDIGKADVIISGIPFSFLKPVQRHQLLHKIDDRLRPGGRFIGYQVTTHLVPLMKYHFEDVDVQFEIRNIPPHFVFTGFKAK